MRVANHLELANRNSACEPWKAGVSSVPPALAQMGRLVSQADIAVALLMRVVSPGPAGTEKGKISLER